jgi:glucose/arabinose dehydrogenase
LDVNSDGERGALGIVLDPRFKSNHFLYVYYTNASPLENRVARFVVDKTSCTTKKDIITGISASSAGYHNGGQLEFVGNKLFVSVGEAHDAGNAQDRSSRLGKILRYKRDGSIPKGNPFSGSGGRNPVWSYGHRNPFGLARKPGSHKLYETENGPDCDDEVNLIRKAHNYGWGNNYQCGSAGVGTNPSRSLIHWTPTIVPTDPWWYRGRMKSLSGSLFMGDYGNGKLHRFIMNSTGTAITADRIIHDDSSGITDVSKGPGGWLYFLTSDAIKRIIPR